MKPHEIDLNDPKNINHAVNAVEMLQLYEGNSKLPMKIETLLPVVKEAAQELYTKYVGEKKEPLNEHATHPMLFALGTDKVTVFFPDIEAKIREGKDVIVSVIRKIRDTLIMQGHIMKFFMHVSEARALEVDLKTEQGRNALAFYKATGRMLPGLSIENLFMVIVEEPDKHTAERYNIDPVTGKLTLIPDDWGDSRAQIKGLFSHIVYKPDEEMELDIAKDMKLGMIPVPKGEDPEEYFEKLKRENPR